MGTRRFDIYAPLEGFKWNGDDFELAPGIRINRLCQPPNLGGLLEQMAKEDWESAKNTKHWLTFEWTKGIVLRPGEIANLVLLSFWLAKPTKLCICFRFHIGRDGAEYEKSVFRMLSRFEFVPDAISPCFEDQDIQSAAKIYALLAQLCRTRGRLYNALYLTLGGCLSYDWQTVLILYAAAAETLLTYRTGRGITDRLAKSYACLTETLPAQRDAAFQEFVALYEVRSDIMHGRIHNITDNDRLPILAQFRDLLRKLWNTVLLSPQLIDILEGTDVQREAYFQAQEQGYVAPKR